MKESNMPRADFVVSIFLTVLGVGILWNSLAMPRFEDQGGTFLDSPGIVPAILAVLLIFLSLVMLVRAIFKKGYKLGINGATITGVLKDVRTMRMLVTIAFGVVYGLFLLRWLHFIASTLIFVFVFVIAFEWDIKRSLASQWKIPVFAAVLSVATTAAVYGAFQYLFLVNMP